MLYVCVFIYTHNKYTQYTHIYIMLELGGMTKNLYHGIFLNYTGFTVYDGIFFFLCMTGC